MTGLTSSRSLLPATEPEPPDIYTLAKQFRTALLAGDDAARSQLLAAYQPIYARLMQLLADLMKARTNAEANGGTINVNWLKRQERYQALLQQVESDMTAYGQTTAEFVRNKQQQAITSATQDAASLIAASQPRPAIYPVINRLPSDEIATLVGFLQNGSSLETLTSQYGLQARDAIKDTLIAGFATGKNAREIGKAIHKAAAVPLDRAVLLARTETLRAYRETSIDRYAKSGVVEKWQWCATLTTRTCPVCIAMHGTLHDLDEPFASHPACRCTPLPVLVGDDEEAPITENGVAWFARQSRESQAAILESDVLHEAYLIGTFTLPDLVGYEVDKKWGPRRFRRSSAQLALSR